MCCIVSWVKSQWMTVGRKLPRAHSLFETKGVGWAGVYLSHCVYPQPVPCYWLLLLHLHTHSVSSLCWTSQLARLPSGPQATVQGLLPVSNSVRFFCLLGSTLALSLMCLASSTLPCPASDHGPLSSGWHARVAQHSVPMHSSSHLTSVLGHKLHTHEQP